MKHRAVKIVFIVLFLLLLYVPTAVWVLAGGRLKNENLENRVLTEKPTFSLDNLEKLPSLYEKYYRDNLPFRNQLISGYARLNKLLFDASIVDSVTFGKNGWLYYTAVNDGNALANYRGEDLFTSSELRQIAVNLLKTREQLKKKGCEFVLFIAPNKERVYPENMPDACGAPAESYAARQLVDFLRKHTDIRVVYPYEEIMQAKADFPDIPLYYAGDSHWNGVGAFVGSRALLTELGIDIPDLARENIWQQENAVSGDLRAMCYLLDTKDPLCTVSNPQRPVYTVASDNSGMIQTGASDGGTLRLFLRNDSYMINMLPYLTPWFSETQSMFNQKYDMAAVDAFSPDVFVQECVERYVRAQLLDGPLYLLPESR